MSAAIAAPAIQSFPRIFKLLGLLAPIEFAASALADRRVVISVSLWKQVKLPLGCGQLTMIQRASQARCEEGTAVREESIRRASNALSRREFDSINDSSRRS